SGHFNDDPHLDLAALTYDDHGTQYLTFLLNDGTGHFSRVEQSMAAGVPVVQGRPGPNLLARDFLGDGRDEVVWTTAEDDLRIRALSPNRIVVTVTPLRPSAATTVLLDPGDPVNGNYGGARVLGAVYLGLDVDDFSFDTFAQTSFAATFSQGGNFGGLNFGLGGVAAPAGGGLSGVVFSDLDGSGTHDPGEPVLPGVTVELIGPGGRQAVTSGPTGAYHFDYVPDGAALSAVLPGNARLTTPATAVGAAPRLIPAQDLGRVLPGGFASADVRVGDLGGSRGATDIAALTGDQVAVRLSHPSGLAHGPGGRGAPAGRPG